MKNRSHIDTAYIELDQDVDINKLIIKCVVV